MAVPARVTFRNLVLFIGILILWLTVGASLPWADGADPATLHIGDGVAGLCPQGGDTGPSVFVGGTGCRAFDPDLTPPFTLSELNELITPGKLDVFKNGGGNDPLKNPVLLIFGVPNFNLFTGSSQPGGSANAPIVTGATLYQPWNGTGTPITTALGSSGAYGLGSYAQGSLFTSLLNDWQGNAYNGNSDIYAFLGLVGNNSNSFTNWLAADTNVPHQLLGVPLGTIPPVPPTGYFIYVYSLQTALLGDKGAIDVNFVSCAPPFTSCTNSLPIGSFVVAYGEGPDTTGPNPFGTPFTEAGLQMPPPLPEPPSWLLLGTGLLGLVGISRRKKSG